MIRKVISFYIDSTFFQHPEEVVFLGVGGGGYSLSRLNMVYKLHAVFFRHLLPKFLNTFSKNCFRNTIIRISNRLEPDQDSHSVSPDQLIAASKLLAKDISNRLVIFSQKSRYAKSVVCCSVDV